MKYILIFFLAALLTACGTDISDLSADEQLEMFSDITGTWVRQPNEKMIENWEPVEKGLIGKGMAVSEANDTVITEVYFLEKVNDSLRLEVQPISEDGISMPIQYFLTEINKQSFVFENPNHTFPKKMTYVLRKNEMSVLLSGEINGYGQQTDLRYTKQ